MMQGQSRAEHISAGCDGTLTYSSRSHSSVTGWLIVLLGLLTWTAAVPSLHTFCTSVARRTKVCSVAAHAPAIGTDRTRMMALT